MALALVSHMLCITSYDDMLRNSDKKTWYRQEKKEKEKEKEKNTENG